MPSSPPATRSRPPAAPDRAPHRALEAELRRLTAAVKLGQKLLHEVNLDEVDGVVSALGPSLPLEAGLRALAEALRAEASASASASASAYASGAAHGDPRARLAHGLRAACADAGLSIRVEGQAPLRLRLDPIVVDVDLDKNVAVLRFAEQELGRCPAQAAAILGARAAALHALEGPGWDPVHWHRQLRAIWSELGGGWQDLVAALPRLCFRLQGPHFLHDPRAEAFLPYPRARFAFDLSRLRRDRALTADGHRLCVAPATGGSLRDKNDVLMIEDADGRAQWHRSFTFVPEEAP